MKQFDINIKVSDTHSQENITTIRVESFAVLSNPDVCFRMSELPVSELVPETGSLNFSKPTSVPSGKYG